jgi:hypothetical protein
VQWALSQAWCDPNAYVDVGHDVPWVQPPALFMACRAGLSALVRLLLAAGASTAIYYGTPGGQRLGLSALLGGFCLWNESRLSRAGASEAATRQRVKRRVSTMALVAEAGAMRDTYLDLLLFPDCATPWDAWEDADVGMMSRVAVPVLLILVETLVVDGRASPTQLLQRLLVELRLRFGDRAGVVDAAAADAAMFAGFDRVHNWLGAEMARRRNQLASVDRELGPRLCYDALEEIKEFLPPA